jgi:drug/metabolite transporter superfamily protein YnfA
LCGEQNNIYSTAFKKKGQITLAEVEAKRKLLDGKKETEKKKRRSTPKPKRNLEEEEEREKIEGDLKFCGNSFVSLCRDHRLTPPPPTHTIMIIIVQQIHIITMTKSNHLYSDAAETQSSLARTRKYARNPFMSLRDTSTPVQPLSRLNELKSLAGSPRELWITFSIKFLDSLAIFSMHFILVLYLTSEFGFSDVKAGTIYGAYGALITTYSIGTGLIIDQIGVVKSMYAGVFISLIGRVIMLFVVASAAGQALLLTVLLCILPIGNSFMGRLDELRS